MAAWYAVTGKIPIFWTEAALGAGVERVEYEKWLRAYGKMSRKELWWPLLKARSTLRSELGDSSEESGGDESAVNSD